MKSNLKTIKSSSGKNHQNDTHLLTSNTQNLLIRQFAYEGHADVDNTENEKFFFNQKGNHSIYLCLNLSMQQSSIFLLSAIHLSLRKGTKLYLNY